MNQNKKIGAIFHTCGPK